MPKIFQTRTVATLSLLALCPACTLVTGAGDYGVELNVSKPDGGDDSGTPRTAGRDFDFTLINFLAHAGIPVDVAVVSQSNALQARAVVLMPPMGSGDYPPERIQLAGILLPGKNQLFFFADKNGDGSLEAFMPGDAKKVTLEHSWIVPIPTNGVLKFPHGTDFRDFSPDDFSQQGDIVFRLPQLAPDALPAIKEQVSEKFETALGDVAELRVYSSDDGRQVGLYRRHAGTQLPAQELRIPGIADPGTLYDFELSIDGKIVSDFSARAPTEGDLTILAAKWLPSAAVDLFPGGK